MSKSLVLTVIGQDKPGLIESLSQSIADHGGNWMESRMARLAGKFAGVVRVSIPEDRADALTTALLAEYSQGLTVVVESAPSERAAEGDRVLSLHLIGQDRPGIVREVSEAVARAKGNIDEMETGVMEATMSGETLFHADAKVRVPGSVAIDELRDALEALADELMVEIALDEAPSPAER